MSTATIQEPTAESVIGLIEGLLGLDVSEKNVDGGDIYSIAEYVDPDGQPVGYIACDLGTACRLGASLTQIPAGRVDEALSDGALPESIAENFDEVFNICVNLIVSGDGARIVLGRTAHGTGSENFEALNSGRADMQTSAFSFDVARYGECRLEIAH